MKITTEIIVYDTNEKPTVITSYITSNANIVEVIAKQLEYENIDYELDILDNGQHWLKVFSDSYIINKD